jgi:hypothetical protein
MKTLKLINVNQKNKERNQRLVGSTPSQCITQTLIKGLNVKTSGFNFFPRVISILNPKIHFEN